MTYNQILKYLHSNDVILDPDAENEEYFTLQDNSDGKGAFIAEWNVPGVAEPRKERLPSKEDSDAWAESKRNAKKFDRTALDRATTVEELRDAIEPMLVKLKIIAKRS